MTGQRSDDSGGILVWNGRVFGAPRAPSVDRLEGRAGTGDDSAREAADSEDEVDLPRPGPGQQSRPGA